MVWDGVERRFRRSPTRNPRVDPIYDRQEREELIVLFADFRKCSREEAAQRIDSAHAKAVKRFGFVSFAQTYGAIKESIAVQTRRDEEARTEVEIAIDDAEVLAVLRGLGD